MIILCNPGGGFHQKRQERWSVSIDGIRIVDLIKQIINIQVMIVPAIETYTVTVLNYNSLGGFMIG